MIGKGIVFDKSLFLYVYNQFKRLTDSNFYPFDWFSFFYKGDFVLIMKSNKEIARNMTRQEESSDE